MVEEKVKVENIAGKVVGYYKWLSFYLNKDFLSIYKRAVASDDYYDLLWIKITDKKMGLNRVWEEK
jgi:hypothetical protein